MDILNLLELMARRSAEMASAAQENDWSRLVDLERRQAMDRIHLENIDPGGRITLLMSPSEKQQKAELIQSILANGEEVLRHVQPYQDSVYRLLSASNAGRSLRQAYAAGA